MAMAAAVVCKPLGILPLTHSGALSTRQRIKSHDHQSQESKAFHHKRVNTRLVYVRVLRPEDGAKAKCTKEGGVEDANTDEPSRADIPESTFLVSLNQPESVKEEEQQLSSAGKEKPESFRGRVDGFANKLGFQKNATTSSDEDLKKQQRQQDFGRQTNNAKQPDARCRLRSLWRTVRRPQNLLAAFLTGLLLYAIALFGWQVMVVAVDVTLFVLKCSCVALALLVMYIFLL